MTMMMTTSYFLDNVILLPLLVSSILLSPTRLTSALTVSQSIVSSESSTSAADAATEVLCIDTPNWVDKDNDNCAYYAAGLSGDKCKLYGADSTAPMGSAIDNCCACGGGVVTNGLVEASAAIATCGEGGGNRGNGICANGLCCSTFGWCGSTPAHCTNTTTTTNTTANADGKQSTTLTFSPTKSTTKYPSTIAAITTAPPVTLAPTTAYPTTYVDYIIDWETLTYSIDIDWTLLTPGHSKFCGPKLVGGYAKAVTMCSPYTECNGETSETHYGSNGNDCPEGLMCFADIDCLGPPTISPTTATPTVSYVPTIIGQTKAPTSIPSMEPTIYIQNAIRTRGSFCGTTYKNAVTMCASSTTTTTTLCISNTDCNVEIGEKCFDDILCTYEDVELISSEAAKEIIEEMSSSSSKARTYIPTLSIVGITMILLVMQHW